MYVFLWKWNLAHEITPEYYNIQIDLWKYMTCTISKGLAYNITLYTLTSLKKKLTKREKYSYSLNFYETYKEFNIKIETFN